MYRVVFRLALFGVAVTLSLITGLSASMAGEAAPYGCRGLPPIDSQSKCFSVLEHTASFDSAGKQHRFNRRSTGHGPRFTGTRYRVANPNRVSVKKESAGIRNQRVSSYSLPYPYTLHKRLWRQNGRYSHHGRNKSSDDLYLGLRRGIHPNGHLNEPAYYLGVRQPAVEDLNRRRSDYVVEGDEALLQRPTRSVPPSQIIEVSDDMIELALGRAEIRRNEGRGRNPYILYLGERYGPSPSITYLGE